MTLATILFFIELTSLNPEFIHCDNLITAGSPESWRSRSWCGGYIDGEIVPNPLGLIGFPRKLWCPADRVSTIEAETLKRG